MNLDNNKILVTGAGGFVGSMLLRRLIKDFPKVKVFITLRDSTNTWRINDLLKKVSIVQVDLLDKEGLNKKIGKIKPGIIFHLAAYGAYPKQTSLDLAVQNNVLGTVNLLAALHDTSYRIFVNTGSSSEYGYKKHPMKETDLLEPNSYYSVTKSAASLITSTYGMMENKPAVTLRLFSVYGPYEEPGRLVSTIVLNALINSDVSVVNNKAKRDFVYMEDVVEAFLSCLKLKNFNLRIFNICSGKQTGIKRMVKTIIKLANSKSRICQEVYQLRPWDSSFWVGDNNLARKVLNWEPRYTISDGVRETIEWFKVNQHLYNNGQ